MKKRATNELVMRYHAVVEAVVDGIITIDTSGKMESANPAACILFGYDRQELLGKSVNMLMDIPHSHSHDQYLHNYLTTGIKKIIGIGRLVDGLRKDGTKFPFWLSVSQMNLNGEIFFVGLVHDVTELKAAENEVKQLNTNLESMVSERTEQLADAVNKLLQSNKKLEHEIHERQTAEGLLQEKQVELIRALERERELSELKSRFVSIASHEFRTPLSTILSSTSLAQRYAERGNMEKQDFHLSKIKSAVNHLTGILNDFLNMTKLEEGRVENNPIPLNFAVFMKEIMDELSGLCKVNQELICLNDEESLPVVLDPSILKHILYNLLSNALKYSDKSVKCHSFIEDNYLIINIIDQGIGIPLAEQNHLFERFFRARNATNIEGTGLGLNIVQHYMNILNGVIEFKSEENIGTEFKVRIPVLADERK